MVGLTVRNHSASPSVLRQLAKEGEGDHTDEHLNSVAVSIAGIICRAFDVLCESEWSVHFAEVYVGALIFSALVVSSPISSSYVGRAFYGLVSGTGSESTTYCGELYCRWP